jgi:Clp amino terminal domain, pathogenicity island component
VFERSTEKARRSIFFARYEASQFGSPYIETEHLLLGLLRENRALIRRFLPAASAVDSIRKQIEENSISRERVSTSVDLPLSNECKRILHYASDEAERLSHKHIGTEHLFLGLLCEDKCFAAELLRNRGLTVEQVRNELAKAPWPRESHRPLSGIRATPIEIHGFAMDADSIRERVKKFREFGWHWEKRSWKARDVVMTREQKISFDVSLAADDQHFTLCPGGWMKERCIICSWELFESADDSEHGTGYTNGRDWVCTECCERFLKGSDYFATAHPEST